MGKILTNSRKREREREETGNLLESEVYLVAQRPCDFQSNMHSLLVILGYAFSFGWYVQARHQLGVLSGDTWPHRTPNWIPTKTVENDCT
jgi:hypothetical protein